MNVESPDRISGRGFSCLGGSEVDKMRAVLRSYLEWLGEGRKETEVPRAFRQIHKAAVRMQYVEVTRTPRGWLVNPTGRRP